MCAELNYLSKLLPWLQDHYWYLPMVICPFSLSHHRIKDICLPVQRFQTADIEESSSCTAKSVWNNPALTTRRMCYPIHESSRSFKSDADHAHLILRSASSVPKITLIYCSSSPKFWSAVCRPWLVSHQQQRSVLHIIDDTMKWLWCSLLFFNIIVRKMSKVTYIRGHINAKKDD